MEFGFHQRFYKPVCVKLYSFLFPPIVLSLKENLTVHDTTPTLDPCVSSAVSQRLRLRHAIPACAANTQFLRF